MLLFPCNDLKIPFNNKYPWSQTLWCPSGGLLGEISVEVIVFMLSCVQLCLGLPFVYKK